MEEISQTLKELSLDDDWYQASLPQKVLLDNVPAVIWQVLRFFPGRRLTCLAEFQGRLVILKYFAAMAFYQSEKAAYDTLLQQGLMVPKLVAHTKSEQPWLMYEYIENAQSWSILNDGERIRAVERIAEVLAVLHKKGFYHTDPHLDNFLILSQSIYLVDVTAIVRRGSIQGTLSNFAQFLSQVYPEIKDSWTYFAQHYFRCQNLRWTALRRHRVYGLLRWHHRKRMNHYLKKVFRSCSEFDAYRSDRVLQVSRRELQMAKDFTPEALPVLRYLKQGNTATVWLSELDGRKVVVKRYNAKGPSGALKQIMKPSRASTSWRNAHLLKFLALPTPQPLLFREERAGWFGKTSYYVSEYVEGEPAHLFIESKGVSEELLMALKTLFDNMQWSYLCQTDLKASNIIIHDENQPYLIDLDSIVQYSSSWSFNRRWLRSWERWLANWQGNNRVIFEQSI